MSGEAPEDFLDGVSTFTAYGTEWNNLGDQHGIRFHTDKTGALVYHEKPTGEPCLGTIVFGPEGWTVERWQPLTISPSILCSCGDHGFIREGKWVKA